MSEESEIVYELVSSDNKTYEITEKALKLSVTMTDCYANCATVKDGKQQMILAKIDGKTLKKVVEWCEHHKEDSPEDKIGEDETLCHRTLPPWDAVFLTNDIAGDLAAAANFLNIPKLMKYCCIKIAKAGEGKNSEEMRAIYGH